MVEGKGVIVYPYSQTFCDKLQILEYGLLSPWLWRSTGGSPALNSSGRKIARRLSAKSYGRESRLFRNSSLWWRCQKTILVLCCSFHTYKTTNWQSFRSVSSWWNSHSLMVTLYVVVNVPEAPALWNLILFPCAFIRLCLWWSLVLNRQKAASSVEQEQCAIFNFMCNESMPALTVHWCMKSWPIKPCGLCVAGQQVSLVSKFSAFPVYHSKHPTSHLGSLRFESWPGKWLFWQVFDSFPQSFQTDA